MCYYLLTGIFFLFVGLCALISVIEIIKAPYIEFEQTDEEKEYKINNHSN